MKLLCKEEALNAKRNRILDFTKGRVYECTKIGESEFLVLDDNGEAERFFDLSKMFEILNN